MPSYSYIGPGMGGGVIAIFLLQQYSWGYGGSYIIRSMLLKKGR